MKLDYKEIVMKSAALGAGGIGAAVLNKHLPANISGVMRLLAILAVGALGPELMGGGKKKSDFIGQVGNGMVAQAATGLMGLAMPSLVAGLNQDYVAGSGVGVVRRSFVDIHDGDKYIPEDLAVSSPSSEGKSQYTA